MPLKFPPSWRARSPEGGQLNTSRIPRAAIDDFLVLIRKTAIQGDLQAFLEHFKRFFCGASGSSYYESSTASWAESDLRSRMEDAAENPPLFLEAFFDACEAIRKRPGDLFAPNAGMINEICHKHNIGYKVDPPNLVLVDQHTTLVPVEERPPTLAEQALEIFQTSLRNAEQLLSEGKGREAVQEALWLIETVTTAFRGMDTGTGTIEGKYFNQIVKELRDSHSRKTLDMVLQWVSALHGYLSSPTGGGVRHGLDIKDGVRTMTLTEARLFCNLIRSYLSFLLAEHERLSGAGQIRPRKRFL